MGDLANDLLAAANALHWFEKYRVANALTFLARLLVAKRISTIEEFEAWVVDQENVKMFARGDVASE